MSGRDLSQTTGLPLRLDGDGNLHFGDGLEPVTPAVRRLDDIRDVLQEPDATGPDELYYMYRNVARSEDRERLTAAGLRYDVTVIRPGLIGQEYNKTAGHYHPVAGPAGVTYPEIYEVAYGEALFLLQQAVPPYTEVTDVVVVPAKAGDRLLVPPGYGHITINAGSDWLVLTNLVEATFGSVYEPVQAMQGGAYYAVVANGIDAGKPAFVANSRYAAVASLRQRQAPAWPELGLQAGQLYADAAADPGRYRYLAEPETLANGLI